MYTYNIHECTEDKCALESVLSRITRAPLSPQKGAVLVGGLNGRFGRVAFIYPFPLCPTHKSSLSPRARIPACCADVNIKSFHPPQGKGPPCGRDVCRPPEGTNSFCDRTIAAAISIILRGRDKSKRPLFSVRDDHLLSKSNEPAISDSAIIVYRFIRVIYCVYCLSCVSGRACCSGTVEASPSFYLVCAELFADLKYGCFENLYCMYFFLIKST